MSKPTEKSEIRIYQVQLSIPPSGSRSYSENITVIAASLTAQRAIDLALQAYPDGTLWPVNHMGGWHTKRVIIDPEMEIPK